MIVLIGGGGAGKTTIVNELVKKGYENEIFYTTRVKRIGEKNMVDHIFIDKQKFEQMRENSEFIAITNVSGNWYGMHKNFKNNCIIISNIDMVEQLKKNTKELILVIYIKTSEKQREERMRKRGDNNNIIHEKLNISRIYEKKEIQYSDYIICNNDLLETVNKVEKIIKSMGMKFDKIDNNNDVELAH